MRPGIIATATAVSLIGACAAQAADLSVYKARPPAPTVAFSWTGAYAGVNLGGLWGHSEVSDVGGIVFPGFVTAGVPLIVEPDSIGILPGSSASHTSFLGGGQVGYNWHFNQLVFGLEGDIDGAHLRGGATASGSIVRAAGVQMTTVTQSTDVDWTASLRARLGYSAGRVLLYATGGAAFAHVDANTLVNVTFPLAVPSAGATATTNSVTRTGWTLGAGVEWAFRDGWSIAGEYRHSDYGRIDTAFALPVFPTFGFVQATALSSVRLTTDQLTARLNYRFGGP